MRNPKGVISLIAVTALVIFPPIASAGGDENVKATVELQILVDEQIANPDHPLPIAAGQSVALRVVVVRKDGTRTDVTKHPKTSYFSLTLWGIQVSGDGVVTVAGSSAFESMKMAVGELGAITVTYGLVGDAEIGVAAIMFEIVE